MTEILVHIFFDCRMAGVAQIIRRECIFALMAGGAAFFEGFMNYLPKKMTLVAAVGRMAG